MSVNPSPPNLDDLRPRRYQEEVFEQAKESNVIAALGTGSGKTYISTLLIKYMSLKPESAGKAIVFLVPKVALVEQQADFIARYSTLRVLKLHGGLNEMMERDSWQTRLESHDVFVITGMRCWL
jgi:endoribonuclease Dicer